MIRLVQLVHNDHGRKVALVREPKLHLLEGGSSVYQLANQAIDQRISLEPLVLALNIETRLEYDPVYSGSSDWTLLPCFDHPNDPMHCMLSGTGLTHKASAENRQKMHLAANEELTDSMKMYQMGAEGGSPPDGSIGVQPEWFYKGNGTMLLAHNEPLDIPTYAEDGGEEPEIAGVYVCDQHGKPFRIGFATANEFSDHVMERVNYLYLAPSKLRTCAIGPELVAGGTFRNVEGSVGITRNGEQVWTKKISSGENNTVHSLANLEYHHFKYSNHQQPGMAHIHFMGADAFSYGEQVLLEDGDVMEVHWKGLGRALRNPLRDLQLKESYFKVGVL